jgi:hypothetical protein
MNRHHSHLGLTASELVQRLYRQIKRNAACRLKCGFGINRSTTDSAFVFVKNHGSPCVNRLDKSQKQR